MTILRAWSLFFVLLANLPNAFHSADGQMFTEISKALARVEASLESSPSVLVTSVEQTKRVVDWKGASITGETKYARCWKKHKQNFLLVAGTDFKFRRSDGSLLTLGEQKDFFNDFGIPRNPSSCFAIGSNESYSFDLECATADFLLDDHGRISSANTMAWNLTDLGISSNRRNNWQPNPCSAFTRINDLLIGDFLSSPEIEVTSQNSEGDLLEIDFVSSNGNARFRSGKIVLQKDNGFVIQRSRLVWSNGTTITTEFEYSDNKVNGFKWPIKMNIKPSSSEEMASYTFEFDFTKSFELGDFFLSAFGLPEPEIGWHFARSTFAILILGAIAAVFAVVFVSKRRRNISNS